MPNRSVSIWKYVKVGKGWRYAKPVTLKNSKPSQDKVMIGGSAEIHTEGNFYLGYYIGSKKVWEKVGPKIAEAMRVAEVKRFNFKRKIEGRSIVPEEGSRILISTAVAAFLEEMKHTARPNTLELFTHDLNEFAVWAKALFMDELTRLDLLSFKTWVAQSGRSERTAGNKLGRVSQWHRSTLKLERGKGLVTYKDSKSEDGLVEVYEEPALKKFFAGCDAQQHLLFTTFLQSGARMSELMYAYWDDIDFTGNILRVTHKPEFDFKTKTHEQREITLPADLMARLAEAKAAASCRLVFPTKGGKPNNKMLPALKRIARRAGLNCGICNSCKVKDECERWFLHKFRATYATTLLRKGMDLVTIRKQLGHKDLTSTTRYLAGLDKQKLHHTMNSVWAIAPAVNREQTIEEWLQEMDEAM